jgi:hypothetical protein
MIEQIRQAFDHLDSLEDTLEGLVDVTASDDPCQKYLRNLVSLREFFTRELNFRERRLLFRLKKDETV